MSTELQKIGPARGPAPAPTVEMLSGQFAFRAQGLDGEVREKLVSSEAVREAFTKIPADTGWLPEGVRRAGNSSLRGGWAVLYVPPGCHPAEFLSDAGEPRTSERLTVPLPGLALFGADTKYWLWALKGEGFEPYRDLYRCPLPNVEPDAAICWGGYSPPRCTPASILQAWGVFLGTPFNNHRCDNKSRRSRDDVRRVLRESAAAGEGTRYPVDDLVRQSDDQVLTLDKVIRLYLETGEMPS